MHTARNSRSRGAWRRIAAGVGLTAVTLGMSVVPAASSTGQAASDVTVLTVATVPSQRIYPPGPIFLPPRVGPGDADFAGHGPDVVADATLSGVGTRNLTVQLSMTAVETRNDFTRVSGDSGVVLIYRAPVGECIQSVSRGTFDELRYVDTDHAVDSFTGQVSGSFVQSWEAVGDTSGNEAGTKTGVSIFTHNLTVTSAPC